MNSRRWGKFKCALSKFGNDFPVLVNIKLKTDFARGPYRIVEHASLLKCLSSEIKASNKYLKYGKLDIDFRYIEFIEIHRSNKTFYV